MPPLRSRHPIASAAITVCISGLVALMAACGSHSAPPANSLAATNPAAAAPSAGSNSSGNTSNGSSGNSSTNNNGAGSSSSSGSGSGSTSSGSGTGSSSGSGSGSVSGQNPAPTYGMTPPDGFSLKNYPGPGSPILSADFNRDGHTDLVLSGSKGAIIAYNDGNGGFRNQQVVGATGPVAVADFNGDGYPDIATCKSLPVNDTVSVFLNLGGTGFKMAYTAPVDPQWTCNGIAAGDVNHDGKADLVLALVSHGYSYTMQPNAVATYLGDGSGNFSALAPQQFLINDPNDGTCGLSRIFGSDFYGDGHFDLMLISGCDNETLSYGNIYYGRSQGDGAFNISAVNSGIESPSDPGSLANLNGDTLPDVLLVGNSTQPHASFDSTEDTITNNGAGQFTLGIAFDEGCYACEYGSAVFSGAAGDFNGDGMPDLVITFTDTPNTCCTPDTPGIVLLKGQNGKWIESQRTPMPEYAGGVIAGDFNGDNRDDFALLTQSGNLLVFTNTQNYPVSSCLPDRAGPHVCSPQSNASYAGSVQFSATGSGVTGPVRLMQLWIDGQKIGEYAGNHISTTVTLGLGAHTATVIQMEYNGQSWKSAPITFQVGN